MALIKLEVNISLQG